MTGSVFFLFVVLTLALALVLVALCILIANQNQLHAQMHEIIVKYNNHLAFEDDKREYLFRRVGRLQQQVTELEKHQHTHDAFAEFHDMTGLPPLTEAPTFLWPVPEDYTTRKVS